MAHRNIEEVVRTIAPSRYRGIPNPAAINVGVSSSNGDLAGALSQAGQQILQLQSAYQQQASLISENTQAIQSNTSSHSSGSGVLGNVTSHLFGGALGFLSPIISGIAGLFGGHSTPQPLPIYTPPPSVSISGAIQATPVPTQTSTSNTSNTTSNTSNNTNQSTYSPHITVNVSAMDSQSFMDRSNDIASAVREAMLNMHPINNVVADL